MLKKIKHYFQEGIWNFSIHKKSGFSYFYYKTLRICYLSMRGFFFDHPCSVSASALTFFTLMSLVPLLALSILIARGFGFHVAFQEQLLVRFPEQTQTLENIFEFANAYLAQIQGGVVAGVGLLVLILAVIFMLRNFELILNQIWNVDVHRSWARVFGDYLLLLLIFPLFFIAANSAAVYVIGFLGSEIYSLFINFVPYLLFWLLFTFLYAFMPNTKVPFRSASLGALLTAALYLIVQWSYLFFQRGAGQYGAAYGTIAALPLFLVWLQLSWYLIIFGAEVAHAHQDFADFEFEAKLQNVSFRFRKLLYLWMIHLGVKKEILTLEVLMKDYKVPKYLSRMALQELVRCHIFQKENKGFKVMQNVGRMKIAEVLKQIEFEGESDFDIMPTQSFEKLSEVLEAFERAVESIPENLKMEDVPDPI